MLDLSGKRFGRLVALEPVGTSKRHGVMWRCKCDCGGVKDVESNSLVQGRTKSCGCISKEIRASGNIRRTHGGCGTRLYRIWKNMKKRCNNTHNSDYQKWYGSKGIHVCEEWSNDFENFRTWSISNGYSDELSLDRIDRFDDYKPSNCRWVTAFEQANNRRGVLQYEFNGESHTLGEWSKITGIKRSILYNRINVYGWSVERALTTVPKGDR